MTTNHPAHGPVSLDRLHQIHEILSKAAAQSDGGNLGYAMADAVKAIGEVLGRRKADNPPVHPTIADEKLDDETLQELIEFRSSTFEYHSKEGNKVQTIIHGVVLSALLELQERRADTLQAGNSPVTPDGWIPVSERMPDDDTYAVAADIAHGEIYSAFAAWFIHGRFSVMEGLSASNYDGGAIIEIDTPITHWMPLPAAPQSEVKCG